MDRFSSMLGIAPKPINMATAVYTRFNELVKAATAVAKVQQEETDHLDPEKSNEKKYREYIRRTHNVSDVNKKRGIAEEVNDGDVADEDYHAIEHEAARRKNRDFDMQLLHKELKNRNLWQWKTDAEASEKGPKEEPEINSLIDELAGRALTYDQLHAIKDHYLAGNTGENGEWRDGEGKDSVFNMHVHETQAEPTKFTDKRLKQKFKPSSEPPPPQGGEGDAGDDDASDDTGMHGGMPRGHGWEPVPGGHHNGFRRAQVGGGYEYWYASKDHSAAATTHHAERSEKYKRKLGRALRSPFVTSETLGKLLDAHVHHENESRRSGAHHKEHKNKKGPHVSAHEKSMYNAKYLSLFVKAHRIALESNSSNVVDFMSYREAAMACYFKASPYNKFKTMDDQTPPGGADAGWQPLGRTRHGGWYQERPNGTRRYWYPSPEHAQHAHVEHAKNKLESEKRARTAVKPSDKEKHEKDAKEHADLAGGAQKYHENERRSGAAEKPVDDKSLAILSKLIGREITTDNIASVSYRATNGGGKDLALSLKYGNDFINVTNEMAEENNTNLHRLSDFLESAGATKVD